jgi:hypothetical protein
MRVSYGFHASTMQFECGARGHRTNLLPLPAQ